MLPYGLKTFNSLSNSYFRYYFANNLVGQAAVNMQGMARSLLVYRLTDSAVLLGLFSVLSFIPLVLLAPFGGALADRMKKKHVVMAGQIGGVLTPLVVAIPLATGYLSADHPLSWWVFVVSYALDGVGMGLTGPSYQAIVREIVRADQVMNALSLNSLGMNVFRFVSPLAAGFVISAMGFAPVFFIIAALFLSGAFFLAPLPAVEPAEKSKIAFSRSLIDVREGFSYVRRQPALFTVLVFMMFGVFLTMPYGSLMPIFADDVLRVGSSGYGILISVSGIGATIVCVVLASLPNKRRGLVMLIGTMFLGLALAGFSFSRVWLLSLVLIFVVGLGDTIRMTLGNTLLLYYSDQLYWGRVMSLQAAQFGLSSLGILLAAMLAERVGVQWAVGGAAIALTLFTAYTLVFVPRLRRLD